jgi:hypothetical protein
MEIPTFITHYFESGRGPFLNICDLPDDELRRLVADEMDSETGFNRFALGPDFIEWRLAADDLLIRAYHEKFGFLPLGRPYFAVLGDFDKTLTMFRQGDRIVLNLSDFEDHEVTFMYPDHSHLTSFYDAEVPHLFYQLRDTPENQGFRGQLFTFSELSFRFMDSGIADSIRAHLGRDSWAGSYVEAQIWCRDHRTRQDEAVSYNRRQRLSLNPDSPPPVYPL